VVTRSKSTQLLSEAAQVVCELMRSTGLGRSVVEHELRRAVENAFLVEDAAAPRDLNPVSEMASLISRWHVDERYVDRTGRPKPLSWNGRRGTLLTLARDVIGAEGARRVLTNVIERGLVHKTADGKWRPKSQVVRPRGLDRPQILRTAVMLRRLLRTVSHNSERRYRGDDLLFEVMTRVPRLPKRLLPAFKKFARVQGMTYVRSVDDWLESRCLPKSGRKAVHVREAGVIVYAFEEPAVDR
jgi:DNA-binding transcriptional ArsR family regulator